MDEQKIRELLQQTRRFKKLADKYEDEKIADINQAIWDCILDILQIDSDRESYFEIFAEYEINHYDVETAINKIKVLKIVDIGNK